MQTTATTYRKNSLVLRIKLAKVVKFGCQLYDQLEQSTVGRVGSQLTGVPKCQLDDVLNVFAIRLSGEFRFLVADCAQTTSFFH